MASTELSLECKVQSYSMLLKYSFGDQHSHSSDNLQDFLSRLEEERLKIDVFKRELPLCMQLLTNAVETSRRQIQACKSKAVAPKPVLEEFIPLKSSTQTENQTPATVSDKANWMTSVQLWSQANDVAKQQPRAYEDGNLDAKQRVNEGEMELLMEDEKSGNEERAENGGEEVRPVSCTETSTAQSHRKARRCWSPDLHRRFLNALHVLGGSQATPKQIRELMKVDGLTNDEVKSHLQKYRLHTRRPGQNPQASGAAAPQLVVVGGIWVPPELYGPSQAASQFYTAPGLLQEFYTTPFQHQVQLYNTPEITQSSQERIDGRSQSESVEEDGSRGGSENGDDN